MALRKGRRIGGAKGLASGMVRTTPSVLIRQGEKPHTTVVAAASPIGTTHRAHR